MPQTTNRGYEVPVTGTEVGTWGDVLNADMALIDNNLGGLVTIPLTNVNVTLSSVQYKCGTIRFTGTLTGNCTITFPTVSGWWVVDNRTTGNFNVILTCGGGENIAVPQSAATDILADGLNIRFRNLPPVGTYLDDAGSAVPIWVTACTVPPYLLCDGTTFSAVTYPILNAKLGTTTLPDFQGRARFYLGGATGRITTAGSGIDGTVRFSAGGAQSVTLDATMIPSHTHAPTVTDPGHTHTTSIRVTSGGATAGSSTFFNYTNTTLTATASSSATTGITVANANTGGGLAHTNMPPAAIGGITMIRAG